MWRLPAKPQFAREVAGVLRLAAHQPICNHLEGAKMAYVAAPGDGAAQRPEKHGKVAEERRDLEFRLQHRSSAGDHLRTPFGLADQFRQRLARVDDLAHGETVRLAARLDQVATVGQDKGLGVRDQQPAVAGRKAAQIAVAWRPPPTGYQPASFPA